MNRSQQKHQSTCAQRVYLPRLENPSHLLLFIDEKIPSSSGTNFYRVQARLGSGGYGQVLNVVDSDNRKYAMKIIAKNKTKCGEHEMEILKRLKKAGHHHFNMVRVDELYMFKNHVVMVFEMLDIDLKIMMSKFRYSLSDTRAIGFQILVALKKLMEIGIVHTDIKPPNIALVDTRQDSLRVKLLDFGCSFDKNETKPEHLIQTLYYRSPEVILRMGYGFPVDAWSLGCVLAELYLNAILFDVESEYQLLRKITKACGRIPTVMYNAVNKERAAKFYKKDDPCHSLREPDNLEMAAERRSRRLFYFEVARITENVNLFQNATVQTDRREFGKVLVGLLKFDPYERSTPDEIMKLPFFSMDHFNSMRRNDPECDVGYIERAMNKMNVSSHWVEEHRRKRRAMEADSAEPEPAKVARRL